MDDEDIKKGTPKRKNSRIDTNRELVIELFFMIKNTKKWWLLPFLFVLAFLSLFVSLTGSSSILPAIYALF